MLQLLAIARSSRLRELLRLTISSVFLAQNKHHGVFTDKCDRASPEAIPDRQPYMCLTGHSANHLRRNFRLELFW
ncbi:hypothetical protein [[Phormidium] sp. ETS-05]|uniref:hypothetical protein n=1 Tax=[Phormidium] sp. ETS-05 TaxID=222819 RepID=UPI0018EEF37B|nr:hypothetical protein [[Phormidium] sp. ETS-05]